MQKGPLLGRGNTAEIYCWREKEILKLFKKEFPKQGVEKEYMASRKVRESGLPVPEVGDMMEVEGRDGIVYERICGDSMLKTILQKPWTLSKEAKRLAELHYSIHSCSIQGIPGQKEVMEWEIRHTDLLSEGKKKKVLEILKKLPEGEALCHGDFHPGNVVLDSRRAVVLDWMTAARGNPAGDIMRTILLLKDAAIPHEMPLLMRLVIAFIRNRLCSIYLNRYLELSGMSMEDIKRWEVPLAAARLNEWVPEIEKEHLLQVIEKGVKKQGV